MTYVTQSLLARNGFRRRDRIEIRSGYRGRKGALAAVWLALWGGATAGAQAPPVAPCAPGRTALVLSGGGAKGAAHVGVLIALDRRGARPELVVGTSMGAIVGALYASGWSGMAVDSLLRALPLEAMFRAVDPVVPRGWSPLTPMVVWEQGERDFALQSPAVREAETAGLLGSLLLEGNLRARGDFDSLPIPFRAVATDLATRMPVVLDHGDLARAVRASSAVPLLIPPERLDGRVLSDGGLSANLPIAVARALGATRVIASDARGALLAPEEITSPLAVADQLAGFLFQQPEDSLGAEDLLVRHDVRDFATLDFSPRALARLLDRGRATAESALASARCLPRATPSVHPIATSFGGIASDQLRPSERATLARDLGLGPGAPVVLDQLAARVRRLGELDLFREVWLHPGGADSIRFHPHVVRAPRRVVGLDVAYDNELGGRMGVAALDRQLLGIGADATALLTLGRYVKELTLGIRRHFGLERSGVAPTVTLRGSDLGIRTFTASGDALPEIEAREAALFVGVEDGLGGGWLFALGADARVWDVEGDNGSSGGLAMRVGRRAGRTPEVTLDGVWSGTYRRLHAEVAAPWTPGKVEISPVARLGWGELLPLHERFPLGGYEGLPGLHLEELRGEREVLAALRVGWRVREPISLRLSLAAGRVADGGALFEAQGWQAGVRAGVVAETPLGPVRAEYGLATRGRSAVLIRVGTWF